MGDRSAAKREKADTTRMALLREEVDRVRIPDSQHVKAQAGDHINGERCSSER